jgi:adenylate cyclase
MSCDTRSVAEWLIDGARSAPRPENVLQELCDRLCACGIPLWRAAVFVRTLHPHVTGRRFLRQAAAAVHVGELPGWCSGWRESVDNASLYPVPFA